ncbi:073f4970-ec7f-47b2-84ef-0873fcf6a515 [Sclerotinia trifoliorum]|uniref:073f4970-ec7f-47b2-84ef-0873fcf6a515 n=1 Tax=Sclerotinia trifoliorum TaxID=28548 RepID=A0A8H2ZNH1_9HELO|nr:073f4970-ec7f-47b2-84ef-0873fcf6a515 [Sclerotinia trifoliorum]
MPPRILLLGGHGKISLLMTPKILARSWSLVSLVRNEQQRGDILEVAKRAGDIKSKEGNLGVGDLEIGNLEILVRSLEDVRCVDDARGILELVKPDWVVWCAGAGGKGDKSRTYAIDQNACIHFIRASISTPSISKFLLVSALICRRSRAPWWNDDDWKYVEKVNREILPDYYQAKLKADQALVVEGSERKDWIWIDLRPGTLSDEAEKGGWCWGRPGRETGGCGGGGG